MIKQKWVASFMCIVFLSGSALADNATLVKSANPVEFSYPGISLDILGIKPGMSMDSVKKWWSQSSYKSDARLHLYFGYDTFPYSYKTIVIFSQKYIVAAEIRMREYPYGYGDNSMMIQFGSPAAGNVVTAVSRDIKFHQKHEPLARGLESSLVKKYGPESSGSGPNGLYWYFGKDGHIRSSPDGSESCDRISQIQEKEDQTIGDDKTFVSNGIYFCLRAIIYPDLLDPSRASELKVTINSPEEKFLDETQAIEQLRKAAVAAYNKQTPEAPKL